MPLDNAANFIQVTVSTGYTSAATSIVLVGSPTLPTPPYNMVWWDSTDFPNPTNDPNVEVVRVTSATTVSGTTTLTVTRAQESTSATNKNLATKTYLMLAGLTAKVLNTDIPANYTAYNATMTTAGGIPYVTGSGAITADAAKLNWNDASGFLGIGTATARAALHVAGRTTIIDTSASNDAFIYCNAAYNGTNDIALGTGTPSRLVITTSAVCGWQVGATNTSGGTIGSFNSVWLITQNGVNSVYGGNTVVAGGIPAILATSTLLGQAANVGTTTLLAATPGAGMYRVSSVIALTTPPGTSCVLPAVVFVGTSLDKQVAATNTIITTAIGSTTANINGGSAQFVLGSNTVAKYFTTGFTSVGTTTMSYSVRVYLEYLG